MHKRPRHFGFWISDFGLGELRFADFGPRLATSPICNSKSEIENNPKSQIQNPELRSE
jgi:hypothetical protein